MSTANYQANQRSVGLICIGTGPVDGFNGLVQHKTKLQLEWDLPLFVKNY